MSEDQHFKLAEAFQRLSEIQPRYSRVLIHSEHSGEEILGYNEDFEGLPRGVYLINSRGALCLCTPEHLEKRGFPSNTPIDDEPLLT